MEEETMWCELIKMLCVMVNSIEDVRAKTGITFFNQEDFDELFSDLNMQVRHIQAIEEATSNE